MKKYANPMLSIVSINPKDIIATSQTVSLDGSQANESALSSGRLFDSYYEGY